LNRASQAKSNFTCSSCALCQSETGGACGFAAAGACGAAAGAFVSGKPAGSCPESRAVPAKPTKAAPINTALRRTNRFKGFSPFPNPTV
jgi:hypothetical protein